MVQLTYRKPCLSPQQNNLITDTLADTHRIRKLNFEDSMFLFVEINKRKFNVISESARGSCPFKLEQNKNGIHFVNASTCLN